MIRVMPWLLFLHLTLFQDTAWWPPSCLSVFIISFQGLYTLVSFHETVPASEGSYDQGKQEGSNLGSPSKFTSRNVKMRIHPSSLLSRRMDSCQGTVLLHHFMRIQLLGRVHFTRRKGDQGILETPDQSQAISIPTLSLRQR